VRDAAIFFSPCRGRLGADSRLDVDVPFSAPPLSKTEATFRLPGHCAPSCAFLTSTEWRSAPPPVFPHGAAHSSMTKVIPKKKVQV